MPVIMERQGKLTANLTPEQKEHMYDLINGFRLLVADDIPERNILEKKRFSYSDDKIMELLDLAARDINAGTPQTFYTIFDIKGRSGGDILLIKGAFVFACIREGMLHTKNQMTYNDSGLSIDFFNKTPLYQSWLQMMLNDYLQAKQTFKSAEITSQYNSGFFGIGTEFGWYQGYDY